MSKPFVGGTLISLLLLSGTAFADDFFHFENPGGVIWWNTAMNVYVNPYTAKDITTSETLSVYCDDWNSDFSGNPYWYADVNSLTLGNTPKFKYGSTTSEYDLTLVGDQLVFTAATLNVPADPFERYREAAWLDNQWRTHAVGFDQVKLAAAVWTLFVDPSHVGGPSANQTAGLLDAITPEG